MAEPKHTAEGEPDDKAKRSREEARQRRLERSLEKGARGQLSRVRSGQRHSARALAPQGRERI